MLNSSLYSIGHGQKTQEEFLAELKSFDIHFLVDVRTSPYSKWVPQFNQGIIESWLQQERIRYIYMGDYIGGRPQMIFAMMKKAVLIITGWQRNRLSRQGYTD